MKAILVGLALAVMAPSWALAAGAPQPSAEMTSVAAALSGRWEITEEFAPSAANADSAATPQGGVGHGEEVWRSGPGGFTFMEEAHDYTPAGEVFIVGYMWWDATAKTFRGMECNSHWPTGCDVKASLSLVGLAWDGKALTVDIRDPKDPKKLVWHEVFSEITPTSFLQTGDVGQPDGSLKRWVTIHARKVP